ncbi:MAG: dTMP kinase [Alphaproteobacteria bacterium]
MTVARGRFVTLEGGEGAGKSTQLKLLADWLAKQGLSIVRTREPGGSPGAEDIRRLLVEGETGRWSPWSETLLFFAARHDHVERLIKPALATGAWVVSDRFADSTMAYQGAAGGVAAEDIDRLYRLVLDGFVPDLTVILDLPVEAGLARAGRRDRGGGARFERMERVFHERVREGFRRIATQSPDRCALVDADGDIPTVAGRIRDEVGARLGLAE